MSKTIETAVDPSAHRATGAAALALALLAAPAEPARAAGADATPVATASDAACPPLLRHTFNSLQAGTPQSLCQYAGRVVLIVNTASYCTFTPQYEGLEALYRKYRGRGLVVLGFPSNDFGAQEPGTNKEVAEFCRSTYGVEFPMFEKTILARLETHPLYAELASKTGRAPKWNFHQYVVDRAGLRDELRTYLTIIREMRCDQRARPQGARRQRSGPYATTSNAAAGLFWPQPGGTGSPGPHFGVARRLLGPAKRRSSRLELRPRESRRTRG